MTVPMPFATNAHCPIDDQYPPPMPYIESGAPIIMSRVMEVQEKTKTPLELPLATALTLAGSVLQGLFDVEKPSGGVSPLSLYTLIAAESGERKSAVANELMDGIEQHQEALLEDYLVENEEYESKAQIHRIKIESLKSEIKKAYRKCGETKHIEDKLIKLEKEAPRKPVSPRFLHEAHTSASFSEVLSEERTINLFSSSEGGKILKSGVFSDISKWNSLWSGDKIREGTLAHGNYVHGDKRVSLMLMIQPGVLKQYLEKNEVRFHDSGMMSRWLYFAPRSTQGYRFEHPNAAQVMKTSELDSKLIEYLNQSMAMGGESKRKTICLSDEAKSVALQMHNAIESQLGSHGIYGRVKDHASKLMDNVCRVAAIIQLVEHGDTPISNESFRVASQIVHHASWFYRRDLRKVTKEERDLENLMHYLNQKVINRGQRYVRKNRARKFGPSSLRCSQTLNDVLAMAISWNKISVLLYNGIEVIDCEPFGIWHPQRIHHEVVFDNCRGINESTL